MYDQEQPRGSRKQVSAQMLLWIVKDNYWKNVFVSISPRLGIIAVVKMSYNEQSQRDRINIANMSTPNFHTPYGGFQRVLTRVHF
jgi:hypothetical protein